jgi:hypothetical protein
MKFKYDPPARIDLTAGQTAQGACTTGSVDYSQCFSGTIYCAEYPCNTGNCTPSGYCVIGNSAGSNCLDGGSAPYGACQCGGSGSKANRNCWNGCNTALSCSSGTGF